MKGRIKAQLKRSDFVVQVKRAAKAATRDVKKCYWAAFRSLEISRYLTEHEIRKLQLGTSKSVKQGWLNTDLILEVPGAVYLDATKRFPFDNGVFDCVYSEHMIEHVEYKEAQAMLQECFRVLKIGGRLRITTPDLAALLGLYCQTQISIQRRYIDVMVQHFIPGARRYKSVFVINHVFRGWGHKFLYDAEVLSDAMTEAGFVNILRCRRGVSEDPNFQNLETHGGSDVEGIELNAFDTLILEGSVAAESK
jgi:predicted SAM-dependent methyltransferase